MPLAKVDGQLHVEQNISLCPPPPIFFRWLQLVIVIIISV
jgi:hypothetical protein